MTSRSGRGRWERVLAACQQARSALGRDANDGDLYAAPPKRKTPPPAAPPTPTSIPHGAGVRVLFIGEAAARLGMSRGELEEMIARGHVETLPIEFGYVVPVREVERLEGI